nr:hypothetical protein [Mycoplasmopsis bovis]
MSLKVRVQIIDGTLKSYEFRWSNFFSMIKNKARLKVAKDFTLLYTCVLYTKEPIYHRLYQR